MLGRIPVRGDTPRHGFARERAGLYGLAAAARTCLLALMLVGCCAAFAPAAASAAEAVKQVTG